MARAFAKGVAAAAGAGAEILVERMKHDMALERDKFLAEENAATRQQSKEIADRKYEQTERLGGQKHELDVSRSGRETTESDLKIKQLNQAMEISGIELGSAKDKQKLEQDYLAATSSEERRKLFEKLTMLKGKEPKPDFNVKVVKRLGGQMEDTPYDELVKISKDGKTIEIVDLDTLGSSTLGSSGDGGGEVTDENPAGVVIDDVSKNDEEDAPVEGETTVTKSGPRNIGMNGLLNLPLQAQQQTRKQPILNQPPPPTAMSKYKRPDPTGKVGAGSSKSKAEPTGREKADIEKSKKAKQKRAKEEDANLEWALGYLRDKGSLPPKGPLADQIILGIGTTKLEAAVNAAKRSNKITSEELQALEDWLNES